MKETQKTYSDKIEIAKLAEVKTEEKFVKSFRPHKGHTMFEINVKTGDVKKAEFERTELSYEKALKNDFSDKKKIVMQPDCIYVSALNIQNAMKKLGIKISINNNKNKKI